jgi:hypothetical protein
MSEFDEKLTALVPAMVLALKEAENALLDYVGTLEDQGGTMGYGRSVLRQLREVLKQVETA